MKASILLAFLVWLSHTKTSPVALEWQLAAIHLITKHKIMAKPHRKARLCIPDSESKDQRWFIIYYVWDIAKGATRRIREFDCNVISDLKQRKSYCEKRIIEINEELSGGSYYDAIGLKKERETEAIKANPDIITLPNALQLVLDDKTNLKKRSRDSLQQHLDGFKSWLESMQLHTTPPSKFTDIMFEDFLLYLLKEKKLTNRSHNNYLTDIRSLFNLMKKKRYKFIIDNPAGEIDLLNTDLGRNIAYRPEQEDELIKYMKNYKPILLFLCQTMYYTLARTNEISHIQRKHIGMKVPGKIFLPRETCKTPFDRHIEIHPDLEQIFIDRGIYDLDPDDYLFSNGLVPGKEWYNSKYFGTRYRENVLDHLKYDTDYTLYSWRHTGVVKAKLDSNMSDGYIMMQGGWHDTKSYNNYLKSLAVFENKEFKTMFPSMGSIIS